MAFKESINVFAAKVAILKSCIFPLYSPIDPLPSTTITTELDFREVEAMYQGLEKNLKSQ